MAGGKKTGVKRASMRKTRMARGGVKSYLKVSKSMTRQLVKDEFHRMTPDQEVRLGDGNGLYSFPGAAMGAPPNLWTNNNIYDVSEVYNGIAQGTGEGNRFGNVIRPRKLKFSFLIVPNEASIPAPIQVRMWILTFKFDPNNATDPDIWGSMQNWSTTGGLNRSFYDNGNTASGLAGDLSDLMKPVNTDVWTVHKCKTYKLGHASTPAVGTAVYGNNDFKLNIRKTVDLLPYIPKRITYNDANTNSLNKKVFIVFELLRADGQTNNVVTQYAQIYYNFHFKFEST